MTHKVYKSALVPVEYKIEAAIDGFGNAVAAYIAELQHWHDHMLKVRAFDDDPLVRPEWSDFKESKDPAGDYMTALANFEKKAVERPAPYPQPQAPADVVAAVKTQINEDGTITYAPDFEVVNDDPTPEEVLASGKVMLMEAVSKAEAEAIDRIMPPFGKRRLFDLREQEIGNADTKRVNDALAELPDDVPSEQRVKVVQKALDARPAKDAKFMKERQAMREQIAAIQRKAAEALAEIEDLTLDTAKDFELPKFD